VNERYVGGTSPLPSMHLVRLIAAYLLCARTWEEVEVLLERLHPKSREPNRKQLKEFLIGDEGFWPAIRKLSQVVRGKTVKRGRHPEGETLFAHTAGDFMRGAREQGIPEEEIIRVAREEYRLSEDEISRLSKVFPPRPSE
jgi:hypothetical protein